MKIRASVFALLGGLLFSLVVTKEGLAAQKPAATAAAADRLAALDSEAMASFKAGKHDAAKDKLVEAVVFAKEKGLTSHALMAQTYVYLGVVQLEGLKDEEKALRSFALALRVRPEVEVPKPFASKAVTAAFAKARAGGTAAAPAAAEPPKDTKAEAKPAAGEKEPAAAPAKAEAKPAASEKTAAAAPAKAEAKPAAGEKAAAAAPAKAEAKPAASEKAAGEAAAAALAKKASEESESLRKDLAQAREREKKEREDRERLQKEKLDTEKQLADARKAKGEIEKQLAEAKEREKQEREAREKLEKAKGEIEKQLAEAKEREKQERDAKAKLEREKQQAQAREQERKGREEKEKLEREKLVEGPELPARLPQPIFCPLQEAVAARDIYLHCAAQDATKVKSLALYYRPAGVSRYNSLGMERTKKGWQVAVIPGAQATGKLVQYYVEARGAKDELVASNGKADLPNLLMLKPAGTPVAAAAPAAAPAAGGLVKASAVTEKAKAPAKKTAARKARGKKR
jgi:hypothetical protein